MKKYLLLILLISGFIKNGFSQSVLGKNRTEIVSDYISSEGYILKFNTPNEVAFDYEDILSYKFLLNKDVCWAIILAMDEFYGKMSQSSLVKSGVATLYETKEIKGEVCNIYYNKKRNEYVGFYKRGLIYFEITALNTYNIYLIINEAINI